MHAYGTEKYEPRHAAGDSLRGQALGRVHIRFAKGVDIVTAIVRDTVCLASRVN